MQDRLSAGKGRLARTVEVLRKVNGLVRKADSLYMYYAWLEAATISIVTLATFWGAGMLLSFGTTTITQQIFMAVALYYMLHTLFTAVAGAFKEYRLYLFNRKIGDVIDAISLEGMTKLDIARLKDTEYLNLRNITGRRGESAPLRIWNSETLLIGATIGFAIGIITLTTLNLQLMLPVFIIACLEVLYRWKSQAYMRHVEEEEAYARRRQNQMLWELTSQQYGFQMKLMRYVDLLSDHYFSRTREIWENARRVARYNAKWSVAVALALFFGHGAFWALFGMEILQGTHTFSKIAVTLAGFHLVTTATRDFGIAIAQLDHAIQDYKYLEQFHTTQPFIDERDAKDVVFQKTPVIEMCNVSFCYPRMTRRALEGCSFTIAAGDKVAFAGRNGSGKTTSVHLLAKVYVPTTGQVRIDGQPLAHITQKSWLDQVIYVMQPPRLPEVSFLEALTAQKPEAIDYERLKKALHYAHAKDIIAALPHGLSTQLGAQWDGGCDVSTGQYQRLALVIAFYRLLEPQIRVAIFDEAMANCDTQTRDHFYKVVSRRDGEFADKTIITILHDPEYLEHFGRVIYFGALPLSLSSMSGGTLLAPPTRSSNEAVSCLSQD
jgi:ABC-type multidrug transport system fused ATPase/permease subunit